MTSSGKLTSLRAEAGTCDWQSSVQRGNQKISSDDSKALSVTDLMKYMLHFCPYRRLNLIICNYSFDQKTGINSIVSASIQ